MVVVARNGSDMDSGFERAFVDVDDGPVIDAVVVA